MISIYESFIGKILKRVISFDPNITSNKERAGKLFGLGLTTGATYNLGKKAIDSHKYFQNEDSKLVSKINKYNQTKYDPNAKVYKPHEYHK